MLLQTREGGRFAKKQKAVLPSDDAATVQGPAAVTIDDDSTAVAVDDESKANSVLKRHFCCDPLLPWRQQSSTQDGFDCDCVFHTFLFRLCRAVVRCYVCWHSWSSTRIPGRSFGVSHRGADWTWCGKAN